MRKILFLTFFLRLACPAIAQNYLYVITDQLNVREKPDSKAPILGSLALGDSVVFLEYSKNQMTASINGLETTASWAKINYKNKMAWVFGGGLCFTKLDIQTLYGLNRPVETSIIENINKLLKDSILTIGGDFIKFKTQIGKDIYVRSCGCNNNENANCIDGYLIKGLSFHPQNKDIVIINMSVVAFIINVYVNLKTGEKFNFPILQECEYSLVSPSGKYVIGIDVRNPQLLLFDFGTSRLINIAQKEFSPNYLDLQWLTDHEVSVEEINQETGKTISKKILLVPQMKWKE
jgi:hypothetical protein